MVFGLDIWSLGVILFMLVCGRAPFYEVNDSETLINIMDVRYSVSDHVSQACQRLVSDDNNHFSVVVLMLCWTGCNIIRNII